MDKMSSLMKLVPVLFAFLAFPAHADCVEDVTWIPRVDGITAIWFCKSEGSDASASVMLRQDGRFEAQLPNGQIFISRTTAGTSWSLVSSPATPEFDPANPTGD